MSAVHGAHLSSLHHVGQQPTIFETLSQESLMTALKPAMRTLIKFLALRNPDRFASASRWYDELYLAFDLALQNHYLKNYGASFSENFYSMKRVAVSTGQAPSSGWARIRQLAILVLWPYLRDKGDSLHDALKERLAFVQGASQPLRIRLARAFVSAWPWLKSILQGLTILLQLGYITSRSTRHNPLLVFAGVRLEKLTPEDMASFDAVPQHLQTGLLNRLWRALLSLPGVFSRVFGYLMFFVQFIDYVYNSDMGAQLKKAGLGSIPPPPHQLLSEDAVMSLETDKCPLCLRKRENDTALAVSGYVFCYSCIDAHVRRYCACPVTGAPATSTQLIRLYTAK